jgi:hypothetical protein
MDKILKIGSTYQWKDKYKLNVINGPNNEGSYNVIINNGVFTLTKDKLNLVGKELSSIKEVKNKRK